MIKVITTILPSSISMIVSEIEFSKADSHIEQKIIE